MAHCFQSTHARAPLNELGASGTQHRRHPRPRHRYIATGRKYCCARTTNLVQECPSLDAVVLDGRRPAPVRGRAQAETCCLAWPNCDYDCMRMQGFAWDCAEMACVLCAICCPVRDARHMTGKGAFSGIQKRTWSAVSLKRRWPRLGHCTIATSDYHQSTTTGHPNHPDENRLGNMPTLLWGHGAWKTAFPLLPPSKCLVDDCAWGGGV